MSLTAALDTPDVQIVRVSRPGHPDGVHVIVEGDALARALQHAFDHWHPLQSRPHEQRPSSMPNQARLETAAPMLARVRPFRADTHRS